MIDYRNLLKKYVAHILHEEGVTATAPKCLEGSFEEFTPEEIVELQKITQEIGL